MKPARHPRHTAIDWTDVHRRLAETQLAIEHEIDPPEDTRQAVLRRRARALAQPPDVGLAADELLEVVSFELAYETYALDSSHVQEVVPLKELTPLPCVPAFVLGIINVRGRIVSVIDLKKFFGLPERGLTDLNKVLILRSARMEFGVLADRILGVIRVPLGALQPSLPTLNGIRADYLKGVTPARMVVLDAAKLLADPNLVVSEDVTP